MIEFGGIAYYIDMAALEAVISLDKKWDGKTTTTVETRTVYDEDDELVNRETVETTQPKTKEIDGAKYDIIRMCFETIMDSNEEVDDTLGLDRALSKTPLAYKLSFNTLIKEGILKEEEQ